MFWRFILLIVFLLGLVAALYLFICLIRPIKPIKSRLQALVGLVALVVCFPVLLGTIGIIINDSDSHFTRKPRRISHTVARSLEFASPVISSQVVSLYDKGEVNVIVSVAWSPLGSGKTDEESSSDLSSALETDFVCARVYVDVENFTHRLIGVPMLFRISYGRGKKVSIAPIAGGQFTDKKFKRVLLNERDLLRVHLETVCLPYDDIAGEAVTLTHVSSGRVWKIEPPVPPLSPGR